MNKKYIIIGLVAIVVLGGVGYGVKSFLSGEQEQVDTTKKKKKIAPPVNVIPVEERAYVKILPNVNGRNLTLEVVEVKKAAQSVDYELEYNAGTLLQGAFGQIDLSAIPARTDILLGSCSAGGACTYHENVQGGTLLLNFDGEQDYGLKSDWKYIDNKAKLDQLNSRDGKLTLSSTDLKTVRYMVIYNSPGFAKDLTGTPVSEIYTLTGSSKISGKGNLSIRMSEETTEAKIMGYDGKAWQEFKTTVEGKEASAQVDLMESYVVIK